MTKLEKDAARKRAKYWSNPAKYHDKVKAWRANNPEWCKNRESKRRLNNPNYAKNYTANWRFRNPVSLEIRRVRETMSHGTKISPAAWPMEFVETWRSILQLKRLCKQTKQNHSPETQPPSRTSEK